MSSNSVVEVDDDTGERHGHITTIIPLTERNNDNGSRYLDNYFVYMHASAFLGFKQVQDKSGHILPNLPDRVRDCDFRMSLDFRDSRLSPLYAAGQLIDALNAAPPRSQKRQQKQLQLHQNGTSINSTVAAVEVIISNLEGHIVGTTHSDENGDDHRHNDRSPPPFAVLGVYRSAVTTVVNYLSYPFSLPLMSAGSTSSDLDRRPYFSRTVPTNGGDSYAAALYLKHLGVTHVGILYISDPWGRAFHSDLQTELEKCGIDTISASYVEISANIEASVEFLAQSQYRYFIGVIGTGSWKEVFRLAIQHKIMGRPDKMWLLTEGSSRLIAPTFTLSRTDPVDAAIANAINGMAFVLIGHKKYEPYERAMIEFSQNETLQKEFVQLYKESALFDNYVFPNFSNAELYQYLTFDAAIAFGIAACETPGKFTGDQLHHTIKNMNFLGASGNVSFNNETGTRSLDSVEFAIRNLLLSEQRSTPTHHAFTSNITSYVSITDNPVSTVQDFIYYDNTTNVPLPLPLLEQEMNLIHPAAHAFGIVIGVIICLNALLWFIWTLTHQDIPMVKSHQPFFLCQLCVGSFIISLTIVPLSMQEPIAQRQLDIACMSIPWLLSIGFVTAFSAIFSKTLRLNQLVQGASQCRRLEVRIRDVMWQFGCLMSLNIISLSVWTFGNPLRWTRIEVQRYDTFRRSLESYGDCRSRGYGNGFGKVSFAYVLPVVAVNVTAVVITLYQHYKARSIPTDFAESKHLAFTVITLLETGLMASLILLAVDDPTIGFLLRSIFIAILSLAVLLPTFIPNYISLQRQIRQHGTRNKPLSSRFIGSLMKRSESAKRWWVNSTRGQQLHCPSSIDEEGANVKSNEPEDLHYSAYAQRPSSTPSNRKSISGIQKIRRSIQNSTGSVPRRHGSNQSH